MSYQQPPPQPQHHAAAGAGPYYSQQPLPPPSRGYVPAGSSVYGHLPPQHDVQQGGYQGSSAHMSYAAHPTHGYSGGLPIHPQYQHQQHQQPGQQPSSYGEPHQYAGHVYQQQPGAYHTSQDDMYHPHHGSMTQSHHGGTSHLDNANGHAGAASGPTGGSGSDTSASALPHGMRPKRRQVKNACINCQKACKKCDEGRPCTRCIKYGLVETCQDSMRKERKRGIKRGPYKRRTTNGSSIQPGNGSSSTIDSLQGQQHQGPPAPQSYHHSEGPNAGGNSSSGSYDNYHMAAPASYRPMQGGNGNGGPYTSSPSPSLFPRDQPRQQPNANDSRGAWAGPLTIDAPSRAMFPQSAHQQSPAQQQQQQPPYSQGQGSPVYPSAQHQQDLRSTSTSLGPNLSSSPSSGYLPAPSSTTNRMLPPSPLYGTFPPPSPTNGTSLRPNLATGSTGSTNNGVGNYLSSYSGSTGQSGQLQRPHSDSSGASSVSSVQYSSPRTPLSANEQLSGAMNGGVAGSYLKSPVSSVATYPQQGQGGGLYGTALSASGPKPFPLQMPQFPRAK